MMTTMEMDDELKREFERFDLEVEKAKHHFGEWDACDEVVWQILRVVQAQTSFARAMEQAVAYGEDQSAVEAAIAERIEAIAALQEAIKQEPRGFQ
jgi:ADP-ribosylglycohydrolase